ncbi:MAG TPA: hypothetical protein VIN03_20945 [Roseateles sp.]
MDHHYLVHETQAMHELATRQASDAEQDLRSLAASWSQGRDAALLTNDLDGLYQRFHAQLHARAADATQARVAHEQALDEALQHLRQSHALQQGLDRTVQRRDRRVAKEAHANERNAASETWVLAQAARKGSK